MASNTSWGIEVGSGALKAVKLIRDGENVIVADVAVIPHKRPLSAPEVDEKEARRLALGALISHHDLTKSSIAVSVPGSQSFARFPGSIPATEPKQIPALVEYEAKQQIPFPLEEVQWDFQTFADTDSPLISVGIFAIRTETVMEQLAKWQEVGRVPDIVTLNPLAVYNAIAYDQQFNEASAGTVIVDIGTTSTDLIIADGAKLWIRTFPIGGHQFTEALVTAYNISYLKAERLKAEAESSQNARQILQALRPVFGDLAQDVQRSIGYYMSQPLNREAKLTRVLCLGNTFQLPGLKKFLSQQLQMEVSMLEGYSRLGKFAGPKVEEQFKAHVHELAPAIGLALQGLDMQTINANLVPMELVKEAMWKGKVRWFAAAAGIALLAGAVAFVAPLRNSAAASPTARPSVIDEVRRTHQGLKSEWTSAEGEYQPHVKAPLALELLDRRNVMPKLLDDVGAMLASASAKVSAIPGEKPGVIEFVDYSSSYGSTEAGGLDPASGQPAGGAGPGVIRSQMTVRVSRDPRQADKFIEAELLGWLKNNADRSGVYYVQTGPGKLQWRYLGKTEVANDGTLGQPVGGTPPSGAGGGPGGGPLRPPGMFPPGGGPRSPGGKPGGGIGGPRNPGGGLGGGMGDAPGFLPPPGGGGNQNDGDADKLAPLPRISPFEPGSTVSTYQVSWEVSFTPPAAPAGQEGKP